MRIIALGFLLIILLGTGLLMLPVSSRSGTATPFSDALFTATSASCVTGLVVYDTATHWSLFGQIVILVLIQIGGLGFMTIATLFLMMMRRKIGLRNRAVLVESISSGGLGGVLQLTRRIAAGTALMEGIGALLLCIRFIPFFGPARGIFYAVFHSVSAFCNAGFDLMGVLEPYSSFTVFAADPLVNLTLMVLIIVGGLGFLVWNDILLHGLRVKRYQFQTKLVLSSSAALILAGALLLYLTEREALAGMSWGERILTSLFGSVTARTAGFNTTDTGALTGGGKLITMILMFIGGSPGSTAGGVKTTTVAVLLLYTIAGVRHSPYAGAFGRRILEENLKRAVYVLFTNLLPALLGALIISVCQPLDLTDVLFETFSAIGTVGMTTGITRALTPVSRYVIILLMYFGRVGSVSFAVALFEKRARPDILPPAESVSIG